MARTPVAVLLLFVVLGANRIVIGQDANADAEGFFESQIRPALASYCVECHGPTKASGGLRLDSREAVFQGGESGPAIVPGDVAASLLAIAIKHDENAPVQMPPKKPLPVHVVADFHTWIARGAKWPESLTAPIVSDKPHWAFSPLRLEELPDDPSGRSQQPIDRLIAAARRDHSLTPVRPAEKLVLLRRAYYDLIGLPPPVEKVEAFLSDDRPDAFARVVDELLASP